MTYIKEESGLIQKFWDKLEENTIKVVLTWKVRTTNAKAYGILLSQYLTK